jgi:hypothetical protein
VVDRPTDQSLRASSDEFMVRLALIEEMETQKRLVRPEDPTFPELAAQIRVAVESLLDHAEQQVELSDAAHQLHDARLPIELIPEGVSAAELLMRWREAERVLESVQSGSPEFLGARLNVETHRRAYNKIFGTDHHKPPED